MSGPARWEINSSLWLYVTRQCHNTQIHKWVDLCECSYIQLHICTCITYLKDWKRVSVGLWCKNTLTGLTGRSEVIHSAETLQGLSVLLRNAWSGWRQPALALCCVFLITPTPCSPDRGGRSQIASMFAIANAIKYLVSKISLIEN